MARPADLPVIEVASLKGQESPTIETAEADSRTLGVRMRGYREFGEPSGSERSSSGDSVCMVAGNYYAMLEVISSPSKGDTIYVWQHAAIAHADAFPEYRKRGTSRPR